MNDDMVKLLASVVALAVEANKATGYENGMIGDYVLVRCQDAGVHAGKLVSHHGRECVLVNARRLWRWVPAEGGLLSSVAEHGLNHADSIVGEAQAKIHLTEACEISLCSGKSASSISSAPSSHR